jgi:hypothetical protein
MRCSKRAVSWKPFAQAVSCLKASMHHKMPKKRKKLPFTKEEMLLLRDLSKPVWAMLLDTEFVKSLIKHGSHLPLLQSYVYFGKLAYAVDLHTEVGLIKKLHNALPKSITLLSSPQEDVLDNYLKPLSSVTAYKKQLGTLTLEDKKDINKQYTLYQSQRNEDLSVLHNLIVSQYALEKSTDKDQEKIQLSLIDIHHEEKKLTTALGQITLHNDCLYPTLYKTLSQADTLEAFTLFFKQALVRVQQLIEQQQFEKAYAWEQEITALLQQKTGVFENTEDLWEAYYTHLSMINNAVLQEIQSPEKFVSPWQAYRQTLHMLREKAKEALLKNVSLEDIQSTLTQDYQALLAQLVEDCQVVLGEPPCAFSFFVTGSLSRQSVVLSSDVEYGIVIETATQETQRYFFTLLRLLDIKCFLIGETILNGIDDLDHHYMTSGFALDSSRHLLTQSEPWLFQTPDEWVESLRQALLNHKEHPSLLQDNHWDWFGAHRVYGSKTLFETLQKELQILEKNFSNRTQWALCALKQLFEPEDRPNLVLRLNTAFTEKTISLKPLVEYTSHACLAMACSLGLFGFSSDKALINTLIEKNILPTSHVENK